MANPSKNMLKMEPYNLSTDIIRVGNQMVFNMFDPKLYTSKGRDIYDTLDHTPDP